MNHEKRKDAFIMIGGYELELVKDAISTLKRIDQSLNRIAESLEKIDSKDIGENGMQQTVYDINCKMEG